MTDKVIRITTTTDPSVGEAFGDLERAKAVAIRTADQKTRDMFAAHALQALMLSRTPEGRSVTAQQAREMVCASALDWADAMMAERARRIAGGDAP